MSIRGFLSNFNLNDTIINLVAASTNLTAAQATGRTIITNCGAGATQAEYVLFTALAGMVYHFLVSAESGDTGGIKIKAGASDVINESGITTVTGGNVQYIAGGLMITATCYVNGKWTFSKKGAEEIAIFKEEKGSGVDGGSSFLGVNIRALNTTTINKIAGCSLVDGSSTFRIRLLLGTYEFEAAATSENSNMNCIFMRNYTDSSNPAGTLGMSTRANGSTITATATLKGPVTITAQKDFELHHYISNALANNGLGRPANSGNNEVYATVRVKRL